jgi:ribosomal protein L32E
MNSALMVDTLHSKGCKFLLTRNFKGLDKTQEAVQKHHEAVAKGMQRKIIIMAIQHEILPDYTILVCTTYPNEKEVEKFGFFPVKKDRANWIPIQYRNRKGKEHIAPQGYNHTTNFNFLPLEEVHEYLKMAEKAEQIQLIYK